MAASPRALLKIVFAAAVVFATAGPHAVAQSDNPIIRPQAPAGARNPFGWLFGEPKKPTESRPAQRVYEPRRRSAPAPRAPLPGPTVPGAPTDPAQAPLVADVAPAPPVATPLHFAVVGDSLAGLLGQGLQEIYADRPFVTIHRRSRDSSGLVRDDFYDWPKALRELLAGPEKFDAVLVLVGTNDRQQLRDDLGPHEPRSERWRDLYADRIDQIIQIARDKRVTLIWVGLPVMRSERYSGDMLAFNEMYRARTQRAGVSYIDIWEAFATEQGEYSVTGPDIGGEIVRLRTNDGVHFTRAGARKAAYFADKALQPIVSAAQARVAVAAAQTPGEAGTPRQGDPLTLAPPPELAPALPNSLRTIDSLLGIPQPDAPLRSPLQPRPVAGPVTPLTGVPAAAGGQLLGPKGPSALAGEARQVFVEGRVAPPKPGRADDFRF